MFSSPIPRSNAHSLHQDSVSKYFDSEHYENLDYIQRRRCRREAEDSDGKNNSEHDDSAYYPSQKTSDQSLERQNKLSHSIKRRTFGLRRPLSPSVTSDDIREQSICYEEFAEKPFSTVMLTSGPMSYADCFPLLMTRSSEAEEKDVTKVQTETRRMSVVSTDYHSGKIHLKGTTPSQDVKLNVFPILHASLSSDTDEEDDENVTTNTEESNMDLTPKVPMYKRMSLSSTSNSDFAKGWNPTRRRTSLLIKGRGNQVGSKSFGRRPQKIARRRSVDSNAISSEHFRALQIIRDRMRASAFEEEEEEEEEDQSATLTEEDEYHLKHAQSTMLHLDKNLKTLEKFLSQIDSSLVKEWSASSMSKDDGALHSYREAEEEIVTSSESEDEEATFW